MSKLRFSPLRCFAPAAGSGGVFQVLFPLRTQPSCGITSHVQSSWVCTSRAKNKLLPHFAGDKVTKQR